MDTKKLPLLRFHNKDLTVVPLPDGEKQGFFRQSPHPGQNPKLGKWQPLDAITFCAHTQIPAVAETRNYWRNALEQGVTPGMGNKTLQSMARDLDQANLPEPAERCWDPKRVNQFLGTEHALEINRHLEKLENERKANGGKSLGEEIEEKANIIQQKVDELQKSPYGKSLLDKLVDLATNITEKRTSGFQKSLVPAKIVIALLVINPILHLGTLQAQDTKALQYPAKEKIEMAYNHLQTLDGAQLKSLLQAIPEKDRVQLVEVLPSKLLPPLIPKGMAARNLNLVPDKELEKGFAKLTAAEFETAAQAIPAESQDALFKLLLKAIGKETSQTKIKSAKTQDEFQPV